jgi:hypothetical protein
MARVPRTPPINTAGVYLVYAPFSISNTQIYKCTAIRNFEALRIAGIDVYTKYYKPFNISNEDYQADAALDAAILTLEAPDLTEYYIPNTYIKSYPGGSGLDYSHKVIVLDLGLMLADVDISYLDPLLIDLIKQYIGVDLTVNTVTVPYLGTISHDAGVLMERARVGAIRSNKTIYQQLEEANYRITVLESNIQELLNVIEFNSNAG